MTKSSGPTSSGEEDVRKGAWTAEEDDKLRAYIEKNGTGHWRSVGRKAGLQRCGKSCRLRWTNYLRPDIKHGSFTPEEEKLIIELHSSLGSRWSLIAAKLPGRTDNDIKNHWNTRLRKKLVDMGIDPVTHKPISELLINLAGNMANCKSGSVPKMLDDARRCFSDAAINKAVQDYVLGGVSMLQQSGSSNAAAAAAAAVQEMEAKMERAGADTQGPLHALPSQAADNLVTFAGMPDMPTFCPAIKTAFSSDSESFSDGSDVDTLSSGAVGSSLSSRRKYGGNGGQHLSLLARRGLGTHSIVIDSDEEIESPRRAVSALEPSVLNRKTRLSLSLQEAMTQGVGLGKRTAENCSTSETTQAGSNKRHHRDLLQCQNFPSQQHQQQQQQQHQQHQHQQQQQQFQQHHTFSFMGSSAMASSAMASGYGGFQAEAMAVAALAPLPPAEAGFGMGEEQGMGFSTSDFEASHLLRSSGQEGYGVPAASCSEWSEESLRQLLEPSSGFWNVEQQQQQGGRGAGGSQTRASSGNGNMPFNDICSLLFTPRGGDGSAAVGAHSTSLQLDSPMGAARCGGNVVDDFFGISPMATPRSWAGSFPNVASETCNSRLQQQQQPSNSCGSSKPDIQACWQDVLLSTPKSMVPDMSHFDLPSPKVVTLWDFHV